MLYNQLGGDWLLVIAGYNGGPGRVLSAIRRTGSRDFWELQYSLPVESRNHVKKFIATHYVMEGSGGVTTVTNQELASLHTRAIEENNQSLSQNQAIRANLPTQQVEGTATQKIQGKYNSVVLATQLAVDIAQFNRLNPHFDKLVHEEEGYELRLPEDKLQQFNTQRYSILQQSNMASLQSVTESVNDFPDPKKAAAAPAYTPSVRKRK
jgi:membrane-bound lytic murein transglycosylase D